MSGPLIVAAVSAALQDRLGTVAARTVPNAVVSTARPDTRRNPEQTPIVNAFLYEVTSNPFLRNLNEPVRRADNSLRNEPLAALDLHYLITFNGAESTLDGQRLAGAVMLELLSEPRLGAAEIARAADRRPTLRGVRLDERSPDVLITPLDLSLDEMSRLWSVLMHEPYALSVQYGATVLLFEADLAVDVSRDVSDVEVHVDTADSGPPP